MSAQGPPPQTKSQRRLEKDYGSPPKKQAAGTYENEDYYYENGMSSLCWRGLCVCQANSMLVLVCVSRQFDDFGSRSTMGISFVHVYQS